MKFSALALDFDGTIARDDVLDPGVREAIAELRAQDIAVLLVTGRILEDLRRVAGDLHFVDAVVAENGAVIEFPVNGYSTAPAEPPSQKLLDELRRAGIRFDAGRVIVESDASEAPRILAIIRLLELPLVLVFNRGRVLVLPEGISVRHLAKYIDIPVPHRRAFVFWSDGTPTERRARTLREFVALVEHTPAATLDGHLRRRDFSRWVSEVFGDYPLAKDLWRLEEEYRGGGLIDVAARVIQAVRARYEFIDPVPES